MRILLMLFVLFLACGNQGLDRKVFSPDDLKPFQCPECFPIENFSKCMLFHGTTTLAGTDSLLFCGTTIYLEIDSLLMVLISDGAGHYEHRDYNPFGDSLFFRMYAFSPTGTLSDTVQGYIKQGQAITKNFNWIER